MAFPTSMGIATRGRLFFSGITVECYPSTVRGLQVEVQAATANSTASSVWSSHIFGPSSAGALRYTVPISFSTRLYYLRARHPAGGGYSAGPFTPTISARAKPTPDVIRPFVMQMTYQGDIEAPSGANVFVSSSKTVKVGTSPTTGTITRTVRFGADTLAPITSTNDWLIQNGQLHPNGVGGAIRSYQGIVILPTGVTITSFATRARKSGSGGTCAANLNKGSSTGGVTTLATNTYTTAHTSYTTLTKSTISQSVGSEDRFYVTVSLKSTGTAQASGYMWHTITYRRPTYSDVV